MKILYALQATGNGHISRANELLPLLEKEHEVDILLSGTQSDIHLNSFVKFRRKGLSFVFGKKGGIDYLKTFRQLNTRQFKKEVTSLPVDQYELVINDFEPLSAWACRMKNIPCVALSHQYAVLHPKAPRPPKADPLAWMVLKYYAPCRQGTGFHFEAYGEQVTTPVIRKAIRHSYYRNNGHYTVYLPAFSEKKLLKIFSRFPRVQWHIFSKHSKKNRVEGNCWIRPVSDYDFISSFTTCEGIVCGAGFETPAEALYMNKKLLVVPMKGQYEQHCNAAALTVMGVTVLKNLKKGKMKTIAHWLSEDFRIHKNYPDASKEVIAKLLAMHQKSSIQQSGNELNEGELSFSEEKTFS